MYWWVPGHCKFYGPWEWLQGPARMTSWPVTAYVMFCLCRTGHQLFFFFCNPRPSYTLYGINCLFGGDIRQPWLAAIFLHLDTLSVRTLPASHTSFISEKDNFCGSLSKNGEVGLLAPLQSWGFLGCFKWQRQVLTHLQGVPGSVGRRLCGLQVLSLSTHVLMLSPSAARPTY